MMHTRRARSAVLLGNFFFGTSVIAVKHISPSLIHPFALTAIRIGITTILFWTLYAFRPVKMGIEKKDYPILFFCAMMGIAANQTFSVKGMSLTSPIHASLLILTTPITITLLAAWFLKERLTAFRIMGLLLGISGGVLLVLSRDISSRPGENQTLGDLFVIAGALGYSVYVIAVKPMMAKYAPMHILQWIFLFGALVSIPVGWNDLQEVKWPMFRGWDWFSICYSVFGATFIAYQLMNYGIRKLGASVTGSFIYTQPFFATVASMLILNEKLSFEKVGAAVLIAGGVYLTNYKRKNKATDFPD